MIDERQALTIANGLRDFGYPGVTSALVLEKAEALFTGAKPDDIIGMFVQKFLSDADLLDGGAA